MLVLLFDLRDWDGHFASSDVLKGMDRGDDTECVMLVRYQATVWWEVLKFCLWTSACSHCGGSVVE